MNNTKEDIDENKILNVKFIRWMKKMDECIRICSITTGCIEDNFQKCVYEKSVEFQREHTNGQI